MCEFKRLDGHTQQHYFFLVIFMGLICFQTFRVGLACSASLASFFGGFLPL